MHSLLPDDPKQVGRYTLLGRLGQGPRGIVYLGRLTDESQVAGHGAPTETTTATEPGTSAASEVSETQTGAENSPADRRFVVKLLPPWPEADTDARARVVDELSASHRVSSAYTARTIEAGWADDRGYLVREHVEGRSLRETVESDGPLTGDALERTAIGTLTALTAIHLAGIAHRGLTPENILLGSDGPRVADFGLGETAYRSPEQVRGEPSGPAADVFAWATTIAYAATGAELFDGSAEAIATARPDLGALPTPLRNVIAACLAKVPAERPTAQGAMLWLLGEEKAGSPAPAIPAAPVIVPIDPAGQAWMDLGEASGPTQAAVVSPGTPEGEESTPVWAVPAQPESPSTKVWGAPALPSDVPAQLALPSGAAGEVPVPAATPAKKPGAHFPVGLVAGVGIVIGLSGLGLWGAGHYSGTQPIGRVAAEGKVTDVPMPPGGLGTVSDQGGAKEPRPQVTVPWAASPNPQDTGVYPMRLATATPTVGVPTFSAAPQFTPPPVPTSAAPTPSVSPVKTPSPAPTVTVTATPKPSVSPSAEPTPTPSASGPSQTPSPSVSGSPTPSGSVTPTPSPTGSQPLAPSGTPTPTPSGSVPVSPQPSPSASGSATPSPTVTRTSVPSPTPTVTRTVDPTARPTTTQTPRPSSPVRPTARPSTNPYIPQGVCDAAGNGTGYTIQSSSRFNGGAAYLLYNATNGNNCVVTMKTQYLGVATQVSATLEVQGLAPVSISGSFKYYAGPVILQGKGKCLKFGGSTAAGSTTAPFGNCG